jgi:ABC-type uncharacterized transport system YnjBCD permease subunit
MKYETKIILILVAIIAALAVTCVISVLSKPVPQVSITNGKLDSIKTELRDLATSMDIRNNVIESLIVHKKLIVVPYSNLKDSSDAAVERELNERIPK